jgi:hypothetical protein
MSALENAEKQAGMALPCAMGFNAERSEEVSTPLYLRWIRAVNREAIRLNTPRNRIAHDHYPSWQDVLRMRFERFANIGPQGYYERLAWIGRIEKGRP